MAAVTPVLAAADLVKSYGGVTALDGAGIALSAGEVHALVGENGAGKSTLVRLLLGIERPDAGTVEVEGAPPPYAGARQAAAAGIAVVAQELSLFPDLTVLENLYPYGPPRRAGLASPSRARAGAREVLIALGLADVPWDTPLGRLDLADRQLVEISRALLGRPRVLVLDEPTSALPVDAVERLFAVIRRLVGGGLAVLYISHFLEEVRRLADRISVLRDGRTVMRGAPVGEVSLDSLVAAMLGDTPPPARAAPRPAAAAPSADGLGFTRVSAAGSLREVSFEAAAGEVTGFTGLQGAGHLTVLDIVCGRARPTAGLVTLPGGGPHRVTCAVPSRPGSPSCPATANGTGSCSTAWSGRTPAPPPGSPAATARPGCAAPVTSHGPSPTHGACGSRARPTHRSARSRAATSRRSSSPSGSTSSPASSSSTTRPGAWTSAPAPRCTRSSGNSGPRARPSSWPPPTSPNWPKSVTGCWSSTAAGSRGSCPARP